MLRGFLLVPVRALQRLQDGQPLDLGQGVVRRHREAASTPPSSRSDSGRSCGWTSATLGDQHRPLHRVLELADVARPPAADQQLVGGRRDALERLLIAAGELLENKSEHSSGMSSARSRSGGTRSMMVLMRKYRSSRSRPSRSAASISMLVAQISRKSTFTKRSPPIGRYSRSCSTRSSLVCS